MNADRDVALGMNEKPGWLRLLDAAITPAVAGLESAPAPNEGKITSIDVDYTRRTALKRHRRACQSCNSAVSVAEPHVRAHVVLFSDVGTGRNHKDVVFCDQE